MSASETSAKAPRCSEKKRITVSAALLTSTNIPRNITSSISLTFLYMTVIGLPMRNFCSSKDYKSTKIVNIDTASVTGEKSLISLEPTRLVKMLRSIISASSFRHYNSCLYFFLHIRQSASYQREMLKANLFGP